MGESVLNKLIIYLLLTKVKMMYLGLLFFACLAMGQKEHPGDELEPTGNTRQRTPFPWNGCSRNKPCGVGQGDCDGAHECQAGLKCGLDNCRDFNARAHSLADCCVGDWVPGWCEDAEGKDQNAGVIEKANLNKEECLRACANHQGATGCEFRVGKCSIHTRNVAGGNGNTGYSCMVFPNKVDSKWSYIVDSFTSNYLSAKGSSLETRKSDGSDDQLWAFDSSGMIVNRGSKLVIDGSGSSPVLVPSSPVQSSKQWMMRLDIKSTQEPDSNSLVPKLKVNSRNSCLNTANRFLPNGAHIIMYECTTVHPDNAGWNIISAGLPSKICV